MNEKIVLRPEDVGKWLIENFHIKYYLKEFYIYKKTGNIKGYNKISRNELRKLIEKVVTFRKKGYNDQEINTDIDKLLEERINMNENNEISMIEKGVIEYFALEDFLKCGYPTCGRIPTHYFFINDFGNIPYCKKHYDQIRNVQDFIGFGEIDEDGTPIVSCYDDGHNYIFYCIYCGENHGHGRGEGHRWAHCPNTKSPYIEKGYILRLETEDEKIERISREKEEKEEIMQAENKWKDMVLLQRLDKIIHDNVILSSYNYEIDEIDE